MLPDARMHYPGFCAEDGVAAIGKANLMAALGCKKIEINSPGKKTVNFDHGKKLRLVTYADDLKAVMEYFEIGVDTVIKKTILRLNNYRLPPKGACFGMFSSEDISRN